jgi:hypothetical protein
MDKCYCIGIIENLLLYTSDNGAAQITGGSAKRSSIEDERGCVQGELATPKLLGVGATRRVSLGTQDKDRSEGSVVLTILWFSAGLLQRAAGMAYRMNDSWIAGAAWMYGAMIMACFRR